jgi:hypothetical protein
LLIAVGTIKSQGQLDGKFRAATTVSRWNVFYFSFIAIAGDCDEGSFRRNPEPQAIRNQRHRTDAAKP